MFGRRSADRSRSRPLKPLPLPGSAWVEIQAAIVKVDRGREVRRVAKATGFPFDAHDFAVETFGDAVRDRMLHESEHTITMTLEDSGDLPHRLEPRARRPPVPA